MIPLLFAYLRPHDYQKVFPFIALISLLPFVPDLGRNAAESHVMRPIIGDVLYLSALRSYFEK